MVGRDEKRKERDRDTERKKHGVQKTNARNFKQFCFVFVRSLFPGISRAFFCTLIYAKELSYIIPGLLVSEIEVIEDLTVKHFESDDEEMDTRGRRAWTG